MWAWRASRRREQPDLALVFDACLRPLRARRRAGATPSSRMVTIPLSVLVERPSSRDGASRSPSLEPADDASSSSPPQHRHRLTCVCACWRCCRRSVLSADVSVRRRQNHFSYSGRRLSTPRERRLDRVARGDADHVARGARHVVREREATKMCCTTSAGRSARRSARSRFCQDEGFWDARRHPTRVARLGHGVARATCFAPLSRATDTPLLAGAADHDVGSLEDRGALRAWEGRGSAASHDKPWAVGWLHGAGAAAAAGVGGRALGGRRTSTALRLPHPDALADLSTVILRASAQNSSTPSPSSRTRSACASSARSARKVLAVLIAVGGVALIAFCGDLAVDHRAGRVVAT